MDQSRFTAKGGSMVKDFHYCAVAILARAAGYPKDDANTIAYASQYTDDSTESAPIKVGELFFDPVRTAYKGIESLSWGVQKKVFIPFHFLPNQPLRDPSDTFRTVPNSPFARDILKRAFGMDYSVERLCAIGIALHTFADTWAHQKFSGRKDEENNVEKIYEFEDGKWKHPFLEGIIADLAPKIGHAQALSHPDEPYLHWRYKGRKMRGEGWTIFPRENYVIFLQAAETIYSHLVKDAQKFLAKQKPGFTAAIDWKKIETLLKKCFMFTGDLDRRMPKWYKEYQKLFRDALSDYSRYTWRGEALLPRAQQAKASTLTNWDKYDEGDFKRLDFPYQPGFYESKWVLFHRAALKQRHFVLERLL